MGRSHRQQVVALTQTRKRAVGRDAKEALLNDIRELVDKFENIYLFDTENMRNVKLKGLRTEWKDSRFFFGRKRLAQVAFGKTVETEHAEGLSKMSEHMVGNIGVLFTNRPDEEVREFFRTYSDDDFARAGFRATSHVQLDSGPCDLFVSAQETQLRSLGLDITLVRGKVTLDEPFTVCEEGDILTPERAKLVEYMGIKMAQFRLNLRCHYSKSTGFRQLIAQETM